VKKGKMLNIKELKGDAERIKKDIEHRNMRMDNHYFEHNFQWNNLTRMQNEDNARLDTLRNNMNDLLAILNNTQAQHSLLVHHLTLSHLTVPMRYQGLQTLGHHQDIIIR
jgi:hypothetical protein